MGVATLATITHLTFKFNAIPLTLGIAQSTLTIQMNHPEPDDFEDEDDAIPDNIMAMIDGKSCIEASTGDNEDADVPDATSGDDSNEEEEVEDAPEWDFSPDEKASDSPTYLFCPLTHLTNPMPIHLTFLPTSVLPNPKQYSSNLS